jgi:ABC-2 type transport system permease protein
MPSLRKKKKWTPLITLMGQFSTRSNLQSSYPRQQPTVTMPESPLTVSSDLGGSDEDPLPTIRHKAKSPAIDPKYNGTLYRSTTARPLLYDPVIHREYVYSGRPLTGCEQKEPSRLVLKARRVSGLIKRYMFIKLRDLHRLANLLYFPVIDILLGGLVWFWMERSNPQINQVCTEYLFSLIFWIVTNSAQFETCFNFLEEFQSHNLLNLFSSTLEHTEWLIASTILCTIEAIMSLTVCGLVAYFSFGIHIFALGWLLPIILLLFIASGWIMAILTTGLFWIFGQRATFLIWAIPYLILPLSAPWYPVVALPGWAQYIAYCLPTTYLFEGVRKIASGGTMPIEYLAISCILTFVYVILAVLFFDRMFKKSREKGLAHLEQE